MSKTGEPMIPARCELCGQPEHGSVDCALFVPAPIQLAQSEEQSYLSDILHEIKQIRVWLELTWKVNQMRGPRR